MKKFLIIWPIATVVLTIIFAFAANFGTSDGGLGLDLGSGITPSSGIPKEEWVFFGVLPSWDVVQSMEAFGEFIQSEDFDVGNPVWVSIGIAIVVFTVMTVVGAVVFFAVIYPKWIRQKYKYSFFSISHLGACALAGLYMVISYVVPSWTTSWGFMSMANEHGDLIYDNWLMVSRIGVLVSPILVLCFVRMMKATKNPLYSLMGVVSTWLYAIIAAVIGVWAGLIMIALFAAKIIQAALFAHANTQTWEVDDYGNKIRRID
jgi:hypothetical protein